jgi:hypothetical protein
VSIKIVTPLQGFERTSLTTKTSRPPFKGTIASACDFIGIDNFIEMARLARANDARAERFMDAWDSLDASERQARGAADAICKRAGIIPTELLRVVAEATFCYSMYTAQMMAALALPAIVERSVDVALTDEGIADRRMLFQHSGFLPTSKGSQVGVTQIVQTTAAAPQPVAPAPRPEDTIQRLAGRLNEARRLPSLPAVALPEISGGAGGDDGK